MKNILIIDDEISICNILSKFLNKNGYRTATASSGKQGLKMLKEGKYDLLLCDYNLGDIYGSDVLDQIQITLPDTIVIFISGYENISTAVNLIRGGAYHYLTKPLYPDLILETIEKAFSEKEHVPDETTHREIIESSSDEYVIGESVAAKELFNYINLVAPTDFSVIIQGETGTGKESVARFLHTKSNRKNKPFIAIDCGSLSKEIAASELFGYEKGAFTGAMQDKEGAFALANGGTIFLDEIGNLPYEIQIYLLRALQEKVIRKVGSVKEIDVDVRIIVASNEDLYEKVKKKEFREDLYHRLNEFTLIVPPLRQREEDIQALVQAFINKASKQLGKRIRGLNKETWLLFNAYKWPGNIRELQNIIKRACLLTPEDAYIDEKSLPLEMTDGVLKNAVSANPCLKEITLEAEKKEILKVLEEVNYNKTRAAAILNIDRKTLYNKLKEMGGDFTI